MSEDNPNELVKAICKTCVDCKYLEMGKGKTTIQCNKLETKITSDNKDCREYQKLEIVKTKSEPLNVPKQEMFCQHYIIEFNGAEAAREAGYCVQPARSKAS